MFKFGDVMCRKFIHNVWSDLIRSRTMKWAKHVAREEEKKKDYRDLVKKSAGRRPTSKT